MRAILLAGLLGSRVFGLCLSLSLIPVTFAADPPMTKPTDSYAEKTITFTGGPYKEEIFKYRLLAPAKVEPGKKYPVVLFLHGAGERGDDNANQLKYFPTWMAEPAWQEKYPCYVIAPQCRKDKKWVEVDWSTTAPINMPPEPGEQMQVALRILDETLKNYPIDPDRQYLTGLSMGGYGSWDLAMRQPTRFAAVVPICGGGDDRHAALLKDLPLWAWHGDQDQAVPVERSRKMIAAIKAAGGQPRYTELPGVGHDSWTPAYKSEELLPWLFAQKRGG
ncbi:MAG: alpha/beta hydrolase-fold protein [Pirellulales bacterium]|nr:alpha/beta hydrolase-fold protein [Pirellulales bacterium]